MPFRCKCGRTFEKVESFRSHTSECATFHHQRVSTSDKTLKLCVQTSPGFFAAYNERKRFSFFSPTFGFSAPIEQNSAPIVETERFSFMMPTALSIHNTFEGVQRKRSMSYTSSAPSSV